jgi:hypothetical protein
MVWLALSGILRVVPLAFVEVVVAVALLVVVALGEAIILLVLLVNPLWQNRLNYSGSSALVIAIQPILTQRTSNGTTHWSVGSSPDATTVQ